MAAKKGKRQYNVNCSFKVSHEELEDILGRQITVKTAKDISAELANSYLEYIDETLEEFVINCGQSL
jgi:hypothetical protein